MMESISKVISRFFFDPMQKLGAEQDPSWRSDLTISQVNSLLEGQPPFTYIISPLAPKVYLLSFVSDNDQSVIHKQFDRLENGNWHHTNGQDNVRTTLREIIRKVMHLEDSMPDPIPYAR